jgi:type IV pilus assembly protein PilC
MKFTYCAFDAGGKKRNAVIEAATGDDARELLRKQGLFVMILTRADAAESQHARASRNVGTARRLRSISTFARQLQLLLSGGTPLIQALAAAERQSSYPAWKRVLADVRARVGEGLPLSEAMRSHPEFFDSVCTSLAAAGESSGAMAPMLERLSMLARKQLQLRSTLTGALVYPAVLMVMGVCVLCVMLLFVLPRFKGLFETLDTPLPPTTKVMIHTSEFLRTYGWFVLIGIGGTGTGIWFASRRAGTRRWFQGIVLKLPWLADLSRSLISARLARMLGALLESKVPLLESLQLTRDSATNIHYADLLGRAQDAVSRGEPVSAILGASDLIHPSVQEAIRNGEQSGQMGGPLINMAEFLDEENELFIKAASRLLEPLILVFLGIMVGMMALSMFLPLFDLVSSASGGGK